MAFFFTNVCKFNNCGLHFATLYDLIQHIEEKHITDEAQMLKKHEQQSSGNSCVPLSYISKFFPRLPDQPAKSIKPEQTICSMSQSRRRMSSHGSHATLNFHPPTSVAPPVSRNQNATAALRKALSVSSSSPNMAMEYDDDSSSMTGNDSGFPTSDDEEITADNSYLQYSNAEEDRRHRCPVSGCNKRYKNMNGMRYHAKIAHRGIRHQPTMPPSRPFKCSFCQKSYKTSQGLQNHVSASHSVGRHGSVTLIASNQGNKGSHNQPAATVRVSPAASPFQQTAPPPVAGGHQYHQTPPYQPQSRQSSGGLSFTVPIVTSSMDSGRHQGATKRPNTTAMTARHYGTVLSRQQSNTPAVSASVNQPVAQVLLTGQRNN